MSADQQAHAQIGLGVKTNATTSLPLIWSLPSPHSNGT